MKLGPQNDGMVVVSDGLAPGDRVVVDGLDRLRDGAKVFIAASDGVAVGAPDAAAAGAADAKGKRHRHDHSQQAAPAESAPPAAPSTAIAGRARGAAIACLSAGPLTAGAPARRRQPEGA